MKQPIAYSVAPSEDQNYVVLTIEGTLESSNTLQPTIEAHELAARLGTNKLLADLTGSFSVRSPLHVVEYIKREIPKEPRIRRSVRIAMLVAPEDHSHDFMETVCINAGWTIRLFRDREKAIEFLTQPRPTPGAAAALAWLIGLGELLPFSYLS